MSFNIQINSSNNNLNIQINPSGPNELSYTKTTPEQTEIVSCKFSSQIPSSLPTTPDKMRIGYLLNNSADQKPPKEKKTYNKCKFTSVSGQVDKGKVSLTQIQDGAHFQEHTSHFTIYPPLSQSAGFPPPRKEIPTNNRQTFYPRPPSSVWVNQSSLLQKRQGDGQQQEKSKKIINTINNPPITLPTPKMLQWVSYPQKEDL